MLPPDVVTKLNECASTDFVSMRDRWFGIVSCATALVAFGLLFEAPELIHNLIPIVRKIVAKLRKLPIESSKHEAPDWVKVVAFFGWIFIVVGVVGEEYAGTKVKDFDANIQECSDAKVREATIEAGDAATSARTAREEADAATADAKELRKESGARRLSAEQKESLRKSLEKMPTPIGVGANPLDSEAEDFTSDLLSVLTSAHWPNVPLNWLPNGKYGLFIGFTDRELLDTPQFKLLRDALKEAHIPATPLQLKVGDKSLSSPAEPHVMYLLIGAHPPVSIRTPIKNIENADHNQ